LQVKGRIPIVNKGDCMCHHKYCEHLCKTQVLPGSGDKSEGSWGMGAHTTVSFLLTVVTFWTVLSLQL